MGNVGYWLGKKRSVETCKKISRAHLGKKLSFEHKRKVIKNLKLGWNKGLKMNPFSLEHRQKIADWHKGRKHSEESKQKMSQSQIGKPKPWIMSERNPSWKGGVSKVEGYKQRITKIYREKNKNKIAISKRRWHINNKKAVLASRHNRRIKEKFAGLLTKDVIQRVYEDNIKRYGTLTCNLCLKPILFGQDSLEHLLPISRGGTNLYENLAIAHKKCNISKGNKTLEEYNIFVEAVVKAERT